MGQSRWRNVEVVYWGMVKGVVLVVVVLEEGEGDKRGADKSNSS